MHGLPDQTVDDAVGDLQRALSLGASHVSWYQLTIEPRTEFAQHPPRLPDEDALGAIESAGLAMLSSSGLQRYEVSAFARDGEAARHNLNYWTFGDYLGIGAGAHGKITFAERNAIVRTGKPLAPSRYLGAEATELRSEQIIAGDARPGEFLLNALRLIDGVDSQSVRTTNRVFAIGDRRDLGNAGCARPRARRSTRGDGTRPALPRQRRQRIHLTFALSVSEIPHLMSQAYAARLEASGWAFLVSGRELSESSYILEAGFGVEHDPHRIRVVFPIRRKEQLAARGETLRRQRREFRVYQPSFVVLGFWPGIGEEDDESVQRPLRHHVGQHRTRIAFDHAHVRQPRRFDRDSTARRFPGDTPRRRGNSTPDGVAPSRTAHVPFRNRFPTTSGAVAAESALPNRSARMRAQLDTAPAASRSARA